MIQPQAREGWLTRAWSRAFGSKDPLTRQLDAVAHEGAHLARFAHAAAFAMLVLFSAGSLVALAGDAIEQIASGDVTIPAIIAAGVSGLLVLAMDTGLIYAASTIRLLSSRHAPRGEFAVHWVVLVGVSILESTTYAYMSWKYENPQGFAWALIAARAAAAPLLSVYLSLARPLPVTARDMLALSERITGEAVLRDLGIVASDPRATLAQRVALYLAAALLTPGDRMRLDALLDVAKQIMSERQTDMPASVAESPNRPPTGPGSPVSASKRGKAASAPSNTRRVLALPAPREDRPAAVNGVGSNPSAEERIYAYLDAHPKASIRTIERRCGVASSTASKHRALWLQERAAQAVQ